jgi:hypothetical protein
MSASLDQHEYSLSMRSSLALPQGMQTPAAEWKSFSQQHRAKMSSESWRLRCAENRGTATLKGAPGAFTATCMRVLCWNPSIVVISVRLAACEGGGSAESDDGTVTTGSCMSRLSFT